MPKLYFDNYSYNIIIVIALILIPAFINVSLNKMYNRLSIYKNTLNKSGKDCIDYFLKHNKAAKLDIYPSQSAGYLDAYSSKKRTLFLNFTTYTSQDVASFSKVIYMVAPETMSLKDRTRYGKLDFIESLISILYIIVGSGLLWFGLLFKINVLILIGLIFHILHFIYHLITYKLLSKRINVAYDFITKVSINENEKIYIKKIYQRQKILYLLGFLLESCKLFNMFLPKNMKKVRFNPKEQSK